MLLTPLARPILIATGDKILKAAPSRWFLATLPPPDGYLTLLGGRGGEPTGRHGGHVACPSCRRFSLHGWGGHRRRAFVLRSGDKSGSSGGPQQAGPWGPGERGAGRRQAGSGPALSPLGPGPQRLGQYLSCVTAMPMRAPII